MQGIIIIVLLLLNRAWVNYSNRLVCLFVFLSVCYQVCSENSFVLCMKQYGNRKSTCYSVIFCSDCCKTISFQRKKHLEDVFVPFIDHSPSMYLLRFSQSHLLLHVCSFCLPVFLLLLYSLVLSINAQ